MALSKITNASVADNAIHGRRNLIINGAMQISQRGTNIDDISGDTAYNMDRFRTRNYGGNGTYDYDQSGNIPDSTFNKSLKLTCKSAATDIGTFGYSLEQIIEGYNIAQLHLGRSTAKPITVSFWVKSSIAGTYSTGLRTTVGEFSFTTEFTLLANTWTYVTYTAPALTTALSSLKEDTDVGLIVDIIGLGAQTSKIASTLDAWEAGNKVFSSNQTAWMSNAGATLNVTGVQLEVGETATPFEHRSFGDELLRCQRYYTEIQKASGQVVNSSTIQLCGVFPTEMRATPSASLNGALTIWQLTIAGSKGQSSSNIGVNSNINSASVFNAECGNFSGLTQHQGVAVAGGDQPLNFDAEL